MYPISWHWVILVATMKGKGWAQEKGASSMVLQGDQTEAQFPLDVHQFVAEFGPFLDAQFDLGQTELQGTRVLAGRGEY